MIKIAYFVEGLTEQVFIEKLISEILEKKNIAVETRKMRGGTNVPLRYTEIGSPSINSETKYYFLIVDCGGETNVASYIKRRRINLIKSGYTNIYGILDVRPNYERNEIPELNRFLYIGIKQRDIPTIFILSIMEIEAWFLADENHYSNIDSHLTLSDIKNSLNFDPLDNTELIDEPASLLAQIYNLAGVLYEKNEESISNTIDALDYENIYINVRYRISSLGLLIDTLDNLF